MEFYSMAGVSTGGRGYKLQGITGTEAELSESSSAVKLKWWPSPQDYNEAVQNPHINLDDAELRSALIYEDGMGLPRPVTGSFASVYRLKCAGRDVALRCFLRNIVDQEERYKLISDFVRHDDLPYTVSFDFLKQGIRVAGNWLPALKMDWVDGRSLDEFLVENLFHPEKLRSLSKNFLQMMDDLHAAGLAHSDLQHGNVIVLENEELRLVDYDGMFVPAMQGMFSNELGHRNYQHPKRRAEDFGPHIDNFSAWVIYASIVAVSVDPALWEQLAAGDDCLLFRQSDFVSPLNSPAFAAFESHRDTELRRLSRLIRAQLRSSPAEVPRLQLHAPEVADLPPLAPVETWRRSYLATDATLPDWLRADRHESGGAVTVSSAQRPMRVPWINPSLSEAFQGGTKALVPKLEDELCQALPRAVRYRSQGLMLSPLQFQLLFLLNPLFWLVGLLFLSALFEFRDPSVRIVSLLLAVGAVVFVEGLVCLPALMHRRWAESGEATLAVIQRKFTTHSGRFPYRTEYHVVVEYCTKKMIKNHVTFDISADKYEQLTEGSVETLLYDPNFDQSAILYKLCRYRAVQPKPSKVRYRP